MDIRTMVKDIYKKVGNKRWMVVFAIVAVGAIACVVKSKYSPCDADAYVASNDEETIAKISALDESQTATLAQVKALEKKIDALAEQHAKQQSIEKKIQQEVTVQVARATDKKKQIRVQKKKVLSQLLAEVSDDK